MTTLDTTAIQEVERLVHEAKAIVIPPALESRRLYYLRDSSGGLTAIEVPLLEASTQVQDMESLRLSRQQRGTQATAYYVGDNQVVLVCESSLDRSERNIYGTSVGFGVSKVAEVEAKDGPPHHRYTVTLPLPVHPAFDIVRSWADGRAYDQKDLVRLLRTKLRGYVAPHVISQLENIRTSFSEETSSAETRAHSGLSREVARTVRQQDGGELLPEFLVEVPVYDVPEYRKALHDISVVVDYDHDRKAFILTAVNDDLKTAREDAVAQVRSDLKDEQLPVYYGTF